MQPNEQTPDAPQQPVQKPKTYLDQVIDSKGDLALLAFVALAAVAGIFLKNEGRWFIWVACLAVLGLFFGVPFFSKEKRAQRGK